MSTRSNIAILLRPEDRNRNFTTPMGTTVNANGKKYLYVYCHNDGYPEGVGADLKRMFEGEDSYEDALEYILAGDRSTTDLTYWEWRRESNVDPLACDVEDNMYQNDYLYIIEEVDNSGRLRVRQYGVEPLTEDDVRDKVRDWFNESVTEEDLESGEYELSDMMYDCLYDLDLDTDTTEDGCDVRDIISETLQGLIDQARENE